MKQNNIIYQLALRTFTPEGTLCAATKHLESLKELGVDWIYLTACFKADADPDRQTWSPRQIASGCDNPNNPYKIADYFHVDEEYGSDEDLCAFIARAHTLELKVMLDLVYLHCGRNAPFLKQHPDYVLQNADGSFVIGERWPFARINFSNSSAREYLFRNIIALSRSESKKNDVSCIAENDVGKVIQNEFFYFSCIHSGHLNASFPWTSHEPFLSSSVHEQPVLPYP